MRVTETTPTLLTVKKLLSSKQDYAKETSFS